MAVYQVMAKLSAGEDGYGIAVRTKWNDKQAIFTSDVDQARRLAAAIIEMCDKVEGKLPAPIDVE